MFLLFYIKIYLQCEVTELFDTKKHIPVSHFSPNKNIKISILNRDRKTVQSDSKQEKYDELEYFCDDESVETIDLVSDSSTDSNKIIDSKEKIIDLKEKIIDFNKNDKTNVIEISDSSDDNILEEMNIPLNLQDNLKQHSFKKEKRKFSEDYDQTNNNFYLNKANHIKYENIPFLNSTDYSYDEISDTDSEKLVIDLKEMDYEDEDSFTKLNFLTIKKIKNKFDQQNQIKKEDCYVNPKKLILKKYFESIN